MKNRPDASVRLALVQLALMVAVVAGFVLDSIVDLHAGHATAADVDAMAGNAMPSIQYLSEARGRLRQMSAYLGHAIEAVGPSRASAREGLASPQQGFDAALREYLSLPYFPGERELYGEVAEAEVAFERRAQATAMAVDAGDAPAARRSLTATLVSADRLDSALERVIAFNAAEGGRVARHVSTLRQTIAVRTILVDVLVGAVAIGATVVAAVAWRRAVAALEQRTMELDIFAGRVAHDVLSPLMGVGLGLSLSSKRLADDPAAAATVERATRALERVRMLVTSLLAFARAGVSGVRETAEVNATLRGVVEGAEHDAAAARVELAVESPRALRVACPPGVLMSLTQNLVGNAIKYMDDVASRRVCVRVLEAGPSLRFEVEDTGPGVPEAIRARLFEPFVRGTDAVPGAGLGLATVKRLAEAHGGRVGCESKPSRGSVFWFELPRAPAPPRRV